MSDDYDEWEEPVDEDPEAAQPELAFPDVYSFVDEWLLPRYRRNVRQTKWDPRWFENLEALDRLEALWRSFEFMRNEGMTGMLVFWRDYFDPTLRELTSEDGVFWYMSGYAETKEAAQLVSEKPPPEVLS